MTTSGPPRPPAAAALLEALRRGDAAAFESLVRTHAGPLLAVARRILRNEDDARDAVQEAFLSAYKAVGAFTGASSLSTWLHRITVNACLMKLRARRRRPEASIDDLLPRFSEDGHHLSHPPDWSADACLLIERAETRRFVRAAIDRLPESYRTVLLLRDIEELDTADAAAALGLSEAVVKVRLHRARRALRTLLARHFEKGAL
ncbi:MAG: sigma-70 family RNA polymerase sigma factor [Vicinamibacteria bacterium]